jgi:hypothetical protein
MSVSVRLKVGQFEVTTDTPEEAARIIQLFDPNLSAGQVSNLRAVGRSRPTLTKWDSERLKAFRALIEDQPLQRQLLNCLVRAGQDGKLKGELVKELKLENAKQLAGPLSGLAKNAEKIGLAREAVYEMEKIQIDGERTYRYTLSPFLFLQLEEEREQFSENADRGGGDDISHLRDFIRTRRAALAGFMEQGATLTIDDDDTITVIPRSEIYVRYLTDNRSAIADLASEFYGRRIEVNLAPVLD